MNKQEKYIDIKTGDQYDSVPKGMVVVPNYKLLSPEAQNWYVEYLNEKNPYELPELVVQGNSQDLPIIDPTETDQNLKVRDYNKKADRWVNSEYSPARQFSVYAPTQWLSPSHWIGYGKHLYNGGDWKEGLFHNSGLVTDEFYQEHPFLSTAINIVADGGIYGLPNMYRGIQTRVGQYINNRLGYYGGDYKHRFLNTLGRRFGIKSITNPSKPQLIRKINSNSPETSWKVENGEIEIGNPGDKIVNFTTDRPVVSHKGGNWDHVADTWVIDPNVPKSTPKSIEPSDMFFENEIIKIKPGQGTLISGNPNSIKLARENGFNVLTDWRLKLAYKRMEKAYEKLAAEADHSVNGPNLSKSASMKLIPQKLREAYAKEVNRISKELGTPTLDDYRLLEQQTGLSAGVEDISGLKKFITELKTAQDGSILKYPNGRPVIKAGGTYRNKLESELLNIQKMPYNKVFYDPATHAEYLFRTTGKTTY